MSTPAALPADFFTKNQQNQTPDTLPADFFSPGGQHAITQKSELPIDWSYLAHKAAQALPAIGAAGMVAAGPEAWPAALGLAALGGGGGEAAHQLIDRAIAPEHAPTSPGEAAANIGKEGAINAGAEGAGRIVSSILGRVLPTAERMYQSALKPRGSLEDARDIVATGIREGIPVSEQGLHQTSKLINNINDQVLAGIDARKAAGLTIDPTFVAKRLDDIVAKYDNTLDKDAARKVVDDVKRRLFEGLSGAKPASTSSILDPAGAPIVNPATPPQPIPIARAQAIKQAEGATVRASYGKPFYDVTVEDKARQQIVRGLKEEIESVFPEVKSLNAREGKLIDLEGALKDFVKREGNHQMTGIGTSLAGAGVALATGSPSAGMEAMMLRGALEDPTIKSKVALMLKGAAAVGRSRAISIPNTIRAVRTFGQTVNDPEQR